MIETLVYGYSSDSTQREVSNEYQHDKVKMIFNNFCIFVLWTKIASALEGLIIKHGREKYKDSSWLDMIVIFPLNIFHEIFSLEKYQGTLLLQGSMG